MRNLTSILVALCFIVGAAITVWVDYKQFSSEYFHEQNGKAQERASKYRSLVPSPKPPGYNQEEWALVMQATENGLYVLPSMEETQQAYLDRRTNFLSITLVVLIIAIALTFALRKSPSTDG